jgi:hypothetical protein
VVGNGRRGGGGEESSARMCNKGLGWRIKSGWGPEKMERMGGRVRKKWENRERKGIKESWVGVGRNSAVMLQQPYQSLCCQCNMKEYFVGQLFKKNLYLVAIATLLLFCLFFSFYLMSFPLPLLPPLSLFLALSHLSLSFSLS